jgi:sialate O-acetylesterase
MKPIRFTLAGLICSFGLPVLADVKLPAVFSDNMVLQKMEKAPFFGTADKGEAVTVKVGEATAQTTAGDDGKWKLVVDTHAMSGPVEISVKGNNTINIKNAIIGEVWIASGQSNMEFSFNGLKNLAEEKAAANNPNVRMFTVQKATSDTPLTDVKGKWELTTPQTVGGFSAVAYFFARELNQKLNVPVGVIHTSWGGTVAEAWTSKEALAAADPEVKVLWDKWDAAHSAFTPEVKAKYEADVKAWQAAGRPKNKQPRQPAGMVHANAPTALYNGMIAPLINYGIKGAIWYQGESNAGRSYQYRKLFPLMIADWRNRWGEGNFPFYYVQLANFMAKDTEPKDSGWAELREAQTMTLSSPNTGMAVIIDIGEEKDIHPKNKQDVGKRLAQWALNKDYGKTDVEVSGPLYDSMKVEGDSIRIKFTHSEGLQAKGDKLTGFAIAGADKKFVWADAKIDGDSVVVHSDQVAHPVAVRYAWGNNPTCDLYNKADLPASPFRTDEWAGVTAGKR